MKFKIFKKMKFKFNISTIIITSLLIISCSKGSTEYNGFIKNSSESTILFKVIGDTLVLDSISVPSGQTKKIYYFEEEGDFEIYDCGSFFDTIYYNAYDTSFLLVKDSASITASSNLVSDEIRVHNCVIDIK